MRAFTIMLLVAMVGAVSLATVGAISTVSQNRHNAIAFSLARGSTLTRRIYDGQPPRADLTATDRAGAGKATGGFQGPLRTADR